ncbi:MAG: chorismate mutase [Spirochaetes bacterium]|nr:chorismate mutase [Spirochaetota bacterium]
MGINEIRENIDRIDQQILELLNERMKQAVLVRKFKEKSEDKARELEVLKKVVQTGRSAGNQDSLLDPAFIEKLYIIIIEESKRVQDLCTPNA